MSIENNIQKLRMQYDNFRKGNEDAFALRDYALSLMKEIGKEGDPKILEEVEDMLIDLEFYLTENKCNCQHSSSCCSSLKTKNS